MWRAWELQSSGCTGLFVKGNALKCALQSGGSKTVARYTFACCTFYHSDEWFMVRCGFFTLPWVGLLSSLVFSFSFFVGLLRWSRLLSWCLRFSQFSSCDRKPSRKMYVTAFLNNYRLFGVSQYSKHHEVIFERSGRCLLRYVLLRWQSKTLFLMRLQSLSSWSILRCFVCDVLYYSSTSIWKCNHFVLCSLHHKRCHCMTHASLSPWMWSKKWPYITGHVLRVLYS